MNTRMLILYLESKLCVYILFGMFETFLTIKDLNIVLKSTLKIADNNKF